MKGDKTILKYPTFKVVQKENGKYWYKPVNGDEEEVLLIYSVPREIHDPDYLEKAGYCDISGFSCDGKNTMYFVKGRTFKTTSPEMVSTIYEIISNYADKYEEVRFGIYADYILSHVRSIPDTILEGLGYIIYDNADFLEEYPGDLLEAIKDYWRYILIVDTGTKDNEYDYNIIFTDSNVVFNEIGQKRIIDGIDNGPIFPF